MSNGNYHKCNQCGKRITVERNFCNDCTYPESSPKHNPAILGYLDKVRYGKTNNLVGSTFNERIESSMQKLKKRK